MGDHKKQHLSAFVYLELVSVFVPCCFVVSALKKPGPVWRYMKLNHR